MNAAAKKFTARNVPALVDIARGLGFEMHKCDSKTYDFSRPGLEDMSVGLSCEDMESARKFTDEVERTFAAYDVFIDNRHRFVRVSWSKSTRTESQLNNMD